MALLALLWAGLASAQPRLLPELREPLTLSEAGLSLDGPAADRLRLDSAFDGARSGAPRPDLAPDFDYHLRLQNGTLRSFTAVDPREEYSLELGQLGLAGRTPLTAPSRYLSVRKWGSFDLPLGFRGDASARASLIGLRARLFYDDAPELDAELDATTAELARRGERYGLTPAMAERLRGELEVDTRFQEAVLPLGSALIQVGRTFDRLGPFDLGFVAGGLARLAGSFPNLSLDQTFGARLRLPARLSLGAFAGVTESAGFVGRDFWRDTLAADDIQWDFTPQVAPHVSTAFWGPLPLPQGGRFSVEGGAQFNPWTYAVRGAATAALPAGRFEATLGGRAEYERGYDLEFERRRLMGTLGLRHGNIEGYAGVSHDAVNFGNASADYLAFHAGLRGEDFGPSRSVALENLSQNFQSLRVPPSAALDILDEASRLARVLEAVQRIREGGYEQGWNDLRDAWRQLDPEMRRRLDDEFQRQVPDFFPLDSILAIPWDPSYEPLLRRLADQLEAWIPDDIPQPTARDIAYAVGLLGRQDLYERALIRFARRQVLESLGDEPVPMLGQDVTFSAPVVLAAAHVYAQGLTPLPPMSERDARESLDPYLFRKLREFAGTCPDPEGGTLDEAGFADCLVGQLPAEAADALRRVYGDRLGPTLKSAIQWHSDLIRRELNRALLEVFLAAEALNDLTEDRGVRLGELDTSWLIRAFSEAGSGGRRALRPALSSLRRELEREVREQEAQLRRRLADFGRTRLAALQVRNPAVERLEVAPEAWAPLYAFYGDEFTGFLERAAERVPEGSTLRVEFQPFRELGTMVDATGSERVVRLPPPARSPSVPLRQALDQLGRRR